MKKIDLSQNVSVVSKHYETKLKQALEKMKIPGPISSVSKYWNSWLYREIIETDWNMKKIDLSPNVSFVSKQNWNKLWIRWKYQAPYLLFRNTETMDYNYREIIETNCNMKNIGSVRMFQLFRNKIETSSGKGENTRPHFWCFETLKQWIKQGNYWNGLKDEENWQSPNVSVESKRFKTKLKQVLEKVKIPGPISGVLKQWNNIGKLLKGTETWRKFTK